MDETLTGLVPLQPLDPTEHNTVGSLVCGMSRTAFGGRNLGDVAETLLLWIHQGQAPCVVYDGKFDTAVELLLKQMKTKGWIQDIKQPQQLDSGPRPLLVIGKFSDYQDSLIRKSSCETIYINQYGISRPTQTRDGDFHNVVFGDPNYVIPVLYAYLCERIGDEPMTIPDFINNLSQFEGVAKQVAHGSETLRMMTNDQASWTLLTLTGAMTVAKQSPMFYTGIDYGMFNYVASTGALMSHGLIESLGLQHYKYDPSISDVDLHKAGLNRITDTLEPETNFDQLDRVMNAVLKRIDGSQPISPALLHNEIGRYLSEKYPKERGILKSAYEHGVPVLVPAFHDSELGNDVYCHNEERRQRGEKKLIFDQEIDTKILMDIAQHAERLGIFSWGGGVPRNFTQNVAPLIDIYNNRLNAKLEKKKFFYGVRVAPDPMWLGHLSGCTYSEGASWGKMDIERGRFTEITADVTMVGPFLMCYALQTMGLNEEDLADLRSKSQNLLRL